MYNFFNVELISISRYNFNTDFYFISFLISIEI